MLGRLSLAVLLLAGAWIGLHYLTKVGKADVIAYKAYQRPAGPGHDGLLPGDVVVLYRDGAMEPICDLQIGADARRVETLESTYVNTLGQSLPFIVAVGNAFRGMMGLTPTDDAGPLAAQAGQFSFSGFERSIDVEGAAGLSGSCECRIARAAARGDRVCTVNAALIEARDVPAGQAGAPDALRTVTRTVAVTLARHTNFLPEERFAACNVVAGEAARQVQQELCNDGESLPLDVQVRRRLNLIEEVARPVNASLRPGS